MIITVSYLVCCSGGYDAAPQVCLPTLSRHAEIAPRSRGRQDHQMPKVWRAFHRGRSRGTDRGRVSRRAGPRRGGGGGGGSSPEGKEEKETEQVVHVAADGDPGWRCGRR